MNQEISTQNSFTFKNTVVLRQKWLNIRYLWVNTCMSRLQMTETNPSNLKLNFFFQVATGEGGGVINLLTIYPFFAMQFQVIQFGFFTINGFKLFYCQNIF